PLEASERFFAGLAFQPVGSARGALPAFPLVGFPGPPAEPGVPIAEHRALRRSRMGGGCSSGGGGPRRGDLRAPVAVADGPHLAGVEERRVVVGGPPSAAAVAAAELFPGDLLVFAPDPSDDPFPGVFG